MIQCSNNKLSVQTCILTMDSYSTVLILRDIFTLKFRQYLSTFHNWQGVSKWFYMKAIHHYVLEYRKHSFKKIWRPNGYLQEMTDGQEETKAVMSWNPKRTPFYIPHPILCNRGTVFSAWSEWCNNEERRFRFSPCWGVISGNCFWDKFEYCYHNLKGNPVPGVITGPLVPGGYEYCDMALQVLGISNLRQ
jgi:hypothetical protein